MNEYVVKFEFFGKLMKTKVLAKNEVAAKQIVIDRINFIEIKKNSFDKDVEYLKSILGMK